MGPGNKDKSFGDEGVEGLDMRLKKGMHNMVTERSKPPHWIWAGDRVRWALSKSSWPHYTE